MPSASPQEMHPKRIDIPISLFISIILLCFGLLGKWSMLDVFVIAVTIVVTKISRFAEAEARLGIYFFGASILLTMFTTERIESLINPKMRDATP